jgi:L-alanine-DL-glutamate epimerase-like enolase superfamily enzyme
MLNVKLMKCAGLTDALRIADYADNKKIALKVGCMGESRLANTAGFHFALSRDSVKYADLDSWVGIVSDCASEGFKFSRGILRPYIRRAGLGARVVIKMNAS